MLKSILTIALRNIFRNPTFSFINLAGLAVSMSLGLLIILIVKEQYTFDTFHHDADRIYRINTMALRVNGETEPYATVPLPVGHAIRDQYTFAEDVVCINRSLNGDALNGNVNVPVQGLFVDPSFLKVFNFPLDRGNPATALTEPNSLILTGQTAERIFGRDEPLGKTLTIGRYGEFVVTGVLQEFAGRTHFEFDLLASSSALPVLERSGVLSTVTDDWNNYYSNLVYFKLKEGGSTGEVEQALKDITAKNYDGLKLEARDKGYEFYLQNLNAITPGPGLSNQMGNGMPSLLIVFLSVLAGIVMLMACFNYTNLMIAKSLSRSREIGIRKVVGARRWQVFSQLVCEAVVFALVALMFSYLILQFLKPEFMKLSLAQEFSTSLREDFSIYLYFLLFAVLVGVIAGVMPAGYLSAFRPVKVLKDASGLKVYSRLTLRQILIVSQFTLSIVFVLVVLVINHQINFMISKDYGFNEGDIYTVRLQGMEFQKLASEVERLPGVVGVGGVSHALGTWADRSSEYKRYQTDESFVMRDFIVDDHYIDNIGLHFIAGQNFDPLTAGEHERHIILNEQALAQFGFTDPVSAIGESVVVNDSVMVTVRGVVKDFHFRPLNYQIGPVAFRYDLNAISWLSARIDPLRAEETIASIQSIWKTLDPVHAFDGLSMADQIDQAYEQAGFFDILKIVGYISVLTITLACMGMLGMAMYSTQTRIKEIGVRKVMGASVTEITLLLSKSFFMLIAIALVLGTPAAYFLGEEILSTFAYKVAVTPLLLLSGIAIVLMVGLLTIGSQTMRAASANPVDSLRYE